MVIVIIHYMISSSLLYREEKRYVKKEWSKIHPGDFIHLSCNEIIPADILFIHSSDKQGICHIETSNLDGENNLKQRQIVDGIGNVSEVSLHTCIKIVNIYNCLTVFDLL